MLESWPSCHADKLVCKSPDLMRLDNKDLRLELWKKGLDLGRAAYRFAHPSLRAGYDELRSTKVEASELSPLPDGAHWLVALDAVFKHLKPYADISAARADAKRQLQDYLLRLIGGGHVLVLGYALPRQPEDYPVLIPIDVWRGKIGWAESLVKGNGLEFVAVRVVVSRTAQGLLEANEQRQLPAPKKTGRPSLKADIMEAYEALRDTREIDFGNPMSRLFPQVRTWLSEKYPDNAGQFRKMASETIRRQVSDLFKRDRESHKQ